MEQACQASGEYNLDHSYTHPSNTDKCRTQYFVQLFKNSKASTEDDFLHDRKRWLSYEGREGRGRRGTS